MRYNTAYAAKLEEKKVRKEAQKKAASAPAPGLAANPFSVSTPEQFQIQAHSNKMQASAAPMTFGLGDQIFGQPPTPASDSPAVDKEDDDSASEGSSSEDSLITAMASVAVKESEWATAPSYRPIYLSTMTEYIPPAVKQKNLPDLRLGEQLGDDHGGKDASWGFEAYENMLKVDNVFDRFTKRINHAAEQCLRCVALRTVAWRLLMAGLQL